MWLGLKGQLHLGGISENFSEEIFWDIKTFILPAQIAWEVVGTLFLPFSVNLIHYTADTTPNSLKE